MLNALADHLWQSTLCLATIAWLTLSLRRQSALVRLWMWRIAALKFLVPFALLYALGTWLGFPGSHAGDEAPAFLVAGFAWCKPLFSPAQSASLGAWPALGLTVFLATLTIAWSFAIRRQMRIEGRRAHGERIDAEFGLAAATPGMGFFKAAFLTAAALLSVGGAILAGGVDDRQHRHRLLILNARALREARVAVSIARPGMGDRSRVLADAGGVLIRNANIRELLAIAYDVRHSAVFGDQMASGADADPSYFWMISPRYDVRIDAPMREPEKFESYALHQVVTRMLAERFGIEVHVNDKCAPPCGRYGVPLSDSPL
jgi:hypothetical protein